MEIKVMSIRNHGDHNEECVLLVALQDCNVYSYELVDSTYTPDMEISNKVRHTYRFPDNEVKADDYILVWTKHGENRMVREGPVAYHHFFLNLDRSIWNDSGDKAYVRKIKTQQSFEVE